MNKEEFIKLYQDWYYSWCFSAFGPSNTNSKEYYDKLKQWCINNHNDAIKFITEILEKEPNNIVMILNDIFNDDHNIEFNIYMSLDELCNIWLNKIHKNSKQIDYYKDWRKWNKYLSNHYMNWRPNLENDPNVTLEEFKEGKRNNESNRSWHEFPLSILKDDELLQLQKDGHLSNMTKFIAELRFFYNRVDEEVKRRKLNKV